MLSTVSLYDLSYLSKNK